MDSGRRGTWGALALLVVMGLSAPTGGALVCHLRIRETFTGGGCCHTPGICDYFVYTYDAGCVGSCQPPKWCCVGSTESVLVYWYQDCYGDCNRVQDCILGEYQINYGTAAADALTCASSARMRLTAALAAA